MGRASGVRAGLHSYALIARSTTSGGGTSDTRSPVSPSAMSMPPVTALAASSMGAAVEAHRARELKWISVMSTTPARRRGRARRFVNCFRREYLRRYGTRCGHTSQIVRRNASRDCMRSLGNEKRCRLLRKFRGTLRFVLRAIRSCLCRMVHWSRFCRRT